MSTTPAAKRRRLDTVSQTLSRPFRSPFKSPLIKSQIDPSVTTPTTGGTTATNEEVDIQHVSSTPTRAKPAAVAVVAAVATRTPRPRPNQYISGIRSTTRSSLASDPEVGSLMKSQRGLEQQLAAMRTEVDTLRQAYKIESTDSDAELETLIAKWKTASRKAAEVVYIDVRDRVNR